MKQNIDLAVAKRQGQGREELPRVKLQAAAM